MRLFVTLSVMHINQTDTSPPRLPNHNSCTQSMPLVKKRVLHTDKKATKYRLLWHAMIVCHRLEEHLSLTQNPSFCAKFVGFGVTYAQQQYARLIWVRTCLKR